MSHADTQESIQRQIRAEKVGALSQAFERLEEALAALAAHDAAGAGGGPAAPEARRLLLEEAAERLWFIVIQREAMGLRRHDVLHDVLRIPGEVRLAMGPRPRR